VERSSKLTEAKIESIFFQKGPEQARSTETSILKTVYAINRAGFSG
jgi:shikimate kinase